MPTLPNGIMSLCAQFSFDTETEINGLKVELKVYFKEQKLDILLTLCTNQVTKKIADLCDIYQFIVLAHVTKGFCRRL